MTTELGSHDVAVEMDCLCLIAASSALGTFPLQMPWDLGPRAFTSKVYKDRPGSRAQ